MQDLRRAFKELRMAVNWRRQMRATWLVTGRMLAQVIRHDISLVAAGCAFYATLAMFPALSVMVSLYGLLFDPGSVGRQMQLLRGLLPPDAYTLIADQVTALVARPPAVLGLGLGIGLVIALWSASAGTKAMLSSLNTAYGAMERRGVVRFQATGLAITLAGIMGAILALAVLVALPAAVTFLYLSSYLRSWLHLISMGVLLLYVAVLLVFLYRFGPSPQRAGDTVRRRLLPGATLATLLWVGVAFVVSLYVGDFGGFDTTYGPLAAVAGVMLWFWASSFVVLVGAELNAVLTKRHRWMETDSVGGGVTADQPLLRQPAPRQSDDADRSAAGTPHVRRQAE
jgi:membrane protein